MEKIKRALLDPWWGWMVSILVGGAATTTMWLFRPPPPWPLWASIIDSLAFGIVVGGACSTSIARISVAVQKHQVMEIHEQTRSMILAVYRWIEHITTEGCTRCRLATDPEEFCPDGRLVRIHLDIETGALQMLVRR